MSHLSDDQLLKELENRLEDHKNMIAKTGSLMVELELLNKKLIDSESLKSNFLSNIRNEIFNPLSVILGLSQNLMDNSIMDPQKINDIGYLLFKESFSLQFQFNNIFHAADLEAGEFQIEPVNVEIGAFIQSIIKSYDHLLKERNLECCIETQSEDSKYFVSDSDKLSIIIVNLLDNAIKFSEIESKILVNYSINDKTLLLSVQDSGVGIDKKDHLNIFDRFTQLDFGSTKKHHGHGLGLSLVREIVKLMEGEIKVESETGKGAKFILILPEILTDPDKDLYSSSSNEEFFEAGEIF